MAQGSKIGNVRRNGMGATERLTAGRVRRIEGSHLFPMGRPQETLQAVLAVLREMRPL
jgi:hypothetical protein